MSAGKDCEGVNATPAQSAGKARESVNVTPAQSAENDCESANVTPAQSAENDCESAAAKLAQNAEIARESAAALTVRDCAVDSPDAVRLLGALNAALTAITGCSGSAGFDAREMDDPRAAFLVAYQGGAAVGCGALRPLAREASAAMPEALRPAAELKRIYAYPNRCGVGRALVAALEARAKALGFPCAVLETRRVNAHAVRFYRALGYAEIPNYGKYARRPEAVCFAKKL